MQYKKYLWLLAIIIILVIARLGFRILFDNSSISSLVSRETLNVQNFPIPDGWENRNQNGEPVYGPVISPDGMRAVFFTQQPTGNSHYIVADGTGFSWQGGMNGVFGFSPDSKKLAFIINSSKNNQECCWQVVVKDRMTPFQITDIFGTKDNALAAFFTFVGGSDMEQLVEQQIRKLQSSVSPDHSLNAKADKRQICPLTFSRTCAQSLAVADEQNKILQEKIYNSAQYFEPDIDNIVFSPNSRFVAYSVGSTTSTGYSSCCTTGYVIVGNTKGPRYSAIVQGSLRFNSDGTQIGYAAIKDNKIFFVTEIVPKTAEIQ